jgi:hypothetical protein
MFIAWFFLELMFLVWIKISLWLMYGKRQWMPIYDNSSHGIQQDKFNIAEHSK